MSSQSQQDRDFLLETAILPDLTPAACEAVTRRNDARSTLDDLYRRNLFLIALEDSDRGATYRYHDLFKTFLRERLALEKPELARELHLRVAVVAETLARAVAHYMQAESWEEAARMVENIGAQLLWQGAVVTLQGWLATFPCEVLKSHPRLSLLAGIGAWATGAFDTAQTLLMDAVHGFQATEDSMGRGEALVYLAACLNMTAQLELARRVADEAFQYPLPADCHILTN